MKEDIFARLGDFITKAENRQNPPTEAQIVAEVFAEIRQICEELSDKTF